MKCAASSDGSCQWVTMDPDDGRPCESLCALDVHNLPLPDKEGRE